ncbi:tetratricopeptide repeat protein [Cypionkella sp.]|uniref:tetratricopeptide repeat protein n=1 Tax=Cypionkella sp. TaxID=2811411 RepID=UPI00262909E5|nr:tetratricopeptide repeat protein [Cypionkella sp.]
MKAHHGLHNRIVAAILLVLLSCLPVAAQTAKLDELFARLQKADAAEAAQIESDIWMEWSKSGSPAMDLLLQRGKDAMANGQPDVAVEHLTALIDHAPDFAEAWNARATAYYQLGEFGPSLSDLGQVLTLNPRHFGALSGLGSIFEELGKPAQALEVYKATLKIDPHAPGVEEAVSRLETELQGKDL